MIVKAAEGHGVEGADQGFAYLRAMAGPILAQQQREDRLAREILRTTANPAVYRVDIIQTLDERSTQRDGRIERRCRPGRRSRPQLPHGCVNLVGLPQYILMV